MKPTRLLAIILAIFLSHTVLAAPAPVSVANTHVGDVSAGEQLLIVHYHRYDNDYDGWNIWTWGSGQEGRAVSFDHETAFGRYGLIRTRDGAASRQGIIVRKNEWEERDIDSDRFIELDGEGGRVTEVWLVAGNPTVFTDPGDVDLSVRLTSAFLDSSDAVTFTTSAPLEKSAMSGAVIGVNGKTGTYKTADIVRSDRRAPGGVVYTLPIEPPVRTEDVGALRLSVRGLDPTTVYARDVLDEPRFTTPNASLGPHYTPEETTFRVWSPVSSRVLLQFYRTHRNPNAIKSVPMTNTGNGVWEATVEGDLDGTIYDYALMSYGKERYAADINAYAATVGSERSVVVDLDSTDPAGWENATAPTLEHPTDEIIYEVHVRDLTARDSSVDQRHRGMYSGLTHRGDMPANGERIKTGLAHFEELGVTAVHLLPIHDFPSARDEYNWGYWTTLFNVPEGNYASDYRNPKAPISELKEAIMGLHNAGIRVILDVVYNHTSSSFEYSHFDNTVPYYYFRTTADGRLRNDAGVGNSVADERVMVRKFISDSLAYWENEYRVDGFRFDLIGTHHPESVRSWIDRLRSERPDLTIYGEPWTGGGPTYFPKGAQRSMGIAVFNDHLRNAIRGDLDGDAQGFANGPRGDTASIKRGVMGAIDDFADSPSETINYASAHDNLTLWDKITKVTPGASDKDRRAMQNLAHAVVLTAQGIAFIHAGADFAGTKNGNHNSYNAGDQVNAFDWPRKLEYRDVFDYTRGLIELRKAHPAFRMSTATDIRRHLDWLDTSDDRLVAYTLNGEAVGDDWATILVAYNGSDIEQKLELPSGRWEQVVNKDSAGVETLNRASREITLPPYSAAVLHK